MIDITQLRDDQQRERVMSALAKRGVSADAVAHLVERDNKWRELSERIEHIRAEKNAANEKIAAAASQQRQSIIDAMRALTEEESLLSSQLETVQSERQQAWRALPNLVQDDVPAGGPEHTQVVAESDVKPAAQFTGREYLDLFSEEIDLERASKVSGSRFVYLKGTLARLELGLVSYVIDYLAPHGFTPVIPPVLIKEEAMAGMGYLEQAGDEVYKTQDDLYLVGTSEQSLGPMHSGEIIPAEQLPLRYVAFSPCFRREAGSHGKDVRGIMRMHQFDKVEMFSFAAPEASNQEHEFLLARQREIMDALQLPYRVVKLAAGDLGAPSAKTYDIETWIPSLKEYRETHSTSNTTDYQARRLNIRTRVDGQAVKVHMLNGTAIAISRLLIALLENHQQQDGSVNVPACLHPYLPFQTITPDH